MIRVGLELEDLLVDGRRPGVEAFSTEARGGRTKLLDGEVGAPGAHVQIAEEVRGIPVVRLRFDETAVLSDSLIQLALAYQVFRLAKCGSTIG